MNLLQPGTGSVNWSFPSLLPTSPVTPNPLSAAGEAASTERMEIGVEWLEGSAPSVPPGWP